MILYFLGAMMISWSNNSSFKSIGLSLISNIRAKLWEIFWTQNGVLGQIGFITPEAKIGDILNVSCGSTPTTKKPDFYNGIIQWVVSGDLNRGIISETSEKITTEAVNHARLKLYPKGTFVIAIIGLEAIETQGNCGILDMDSTISQSCMAFLKLNESPEISTSNIVLIISYWFYDWLPNSF